MTGLCHHCRLRVAYDALECPHCGTRHPVDPDAELDKPAQTLPLETQRAFEALTRPETRQRPGSRLAWPIAAVAALGLAVGYAVTGAPASQPAAPVEALSLPDVASQAAPVAVPSGAPTQPPRAVEAAPPKAALEVGRTYYLATTDSYRGIVACITAEGLRNYQALLQKGDTAGAAKLMVEVGARNHDVADDMAVLKKRKACTLVRSGQRDTPLHLQVAQVDAELVAGHVSNTWSWFTEPLLWTLKAYVRGDQVYSRPAGQRR